MGEQIECRPGHYVYGTDMLYPAGTTNDVLACLDCPELYACHTFPY